MNLGAVTRKPNVAAVAVVATAFIATTGAAWAVRRTSPSPVSSGRPVATSSRTDAKMPGVSLGTVVRDGLRVECRVSPLAGEVPGPPREGQDVRLQLAIADTAGGTPATRLNPSAWIVSHPEDAPPIGPKESARIAASLIQGSIFNPPELDLNIYYVVTLNDDATISVVDPLFGFGGTKLLALIPLAAQGVDWVLGPGGRTLFVAMSEANQVGIVDTRAWKLIASVPAGIRPHRIGLQPDGRRIWVGGGAEGQTDSGVTVLDAEGGKILARIRTGRGRHDLAFSDDSRTVFVSNADEGTVTVIDAETFTPSATVKTGRRPGSLAYSTAARLVYVSDELEGTITAIDPVPGQVAARIALEPGVHQVRFAPDGRAGFVVNPRTNKVDVIDATSNRLVQSVRVQEGPDQVVFSSDFAYVRHRGSVSVVMISLKTAGRQGIPLSTVSFPAGERPPSSADRPMPADTIVTAPGSGAVLVANPGDRSVYYYKEGMSAPMGTFNNYKREPLAVLVIDHSLGERTQPGVYESTVRLGRGGKFDVIFFLDQPRFVHAFPLEIAVDPVQQLARDQARVEVRPLVMVPRTTARQVFRPLFQVVAGAGKEAKAGLRDVEILMFRTGGGWQERLGAAEITPGVYGADFRPESPGIYHVFVACSSVGLSLNNPYKLIVQVDDPGAEPTPKPAQQISAVPTPESGPRS
jgi:YVTN family beta-propeller protein